jgi:serine/threonine protein kinase
MLQPGTIIDGRFQVIDQVGVGGMGIVYRALHLGMQREVAMKVLKAELSGDSIKLQRFRREAQVISVLDHPNIVQIYAVGMVSNGEPYIAMEFISGEQLSDVLKDRGALKWRDAMPLFMQMCDALEYAHKMNIIHRDVKPSNILLIEDKTNQSTNVKLVDFGIAKSLTEAGPALTQTEMVVGSVFYLSPGQFQGRAADSRSDIYSLGCTFFEVLSGAPPYRGDSAFETVALAMSEPVPTVNNTTRTDLVPEDLDYLIGWMLSKDQEKRPAAIADVRDALQKISGGERLQRASTAHDTNPAARMKLSKALTKFILGGIACAALVGLAIVGTTHSPRMAVNDHEQALLKQVHAADDAQSKDLFKSYAELMNFYLGTNRTLEAYILGGRARDRLDDNSYPLDDLCRFAEAYSKSCYATGNWSDLTLVLVDVERKIPKESARGLFAAKLIQLRSLTDGGAWKQALIIVQPMASEATEPWMKPADRQYVFREYAKIAASLGQFEMAKQSAQQLRYDPDENVRVDMDGVLLNVEDATVGGITQERLDAYLDRLSKCTEKDAQRSGLVSAARVEYRHLQFEKATSHFLQAADLCDKTFFGAKQALSILQECYPVARTADKPAIRKRLGENGLDYNKYYTALNDRASLKVQIEDAGVN